MKPILQEIFRFGIVGVAATAMQYALYLLLLHCMPANPAYALGYIISFIGNFFATSYFTFGSRPSWARFVGMVGAHGVNFLLHMVLLNLFLVLGCPNRLAPIPVFAIAIPVNFLLLRFVFKKK